MPPLSPHEQRALAALDIPALLTTLHEWASIPSLNGTAAENTMQHLAADTMRRLGLAVDTWTFSDDDLRHHPAYCAEVARPTAVGVVGLLGEGEGRSLILNGHTDVVPAGDLAQWHYPPWGATINHEEGRVYGRGTLDMKGNLLCALFAAKAIQDAGLTLKGKLIIQAVLGEEDGGIGTLAAIVRGYRADAAVVLEPTELFIAPAQAGALNFRLTIPGLPAHGALRYEGVDPLEKFLLVYQSLLAYETSYNAQHPHPLFAIYPTPYPLCVGTIAGGNWASTVAESLRFEGRLGVAIDDTPKKARARFAHFIQHLSQTDDWLRANPIQLEWWGGQFAPAHISAEHPIAQTVGQAFQTLTGQPPTVQGMPYGADMRLLVNEANIPTILFGAGDVRRAHQFDESTPTADLETLARTLIITILRFCEISQSASQHIS